MRWGLLALVALAFSACTIRVDPPFDALPHIDAGSPSDTNPGADLPSFPDVPIPDVPTITDLVFPDVPTPTDIVDVTDAYDDDAMDAGPRPDLPTFRYCPWEVQDLPRTTYSHVFRDESFLTAESRTSPMDGACDNSAFPDREQPERVFLVEPQDAVQMIVRTRCETWDCDALVVSNDCMTSNIEACLTTDGEERYALDVLPVPHLVVVERRAPFDPGDFMLQVALNDTDGHEECPVVEELTVTGIETTDGCVEDEQGPHYATTRQGDTSLDVPDLVYLDCQGTGIRRDTTGGAPDLIWSLTADQQDGASRSLTVELRPGGDWESFLAVTTAPCGATDAVIDCAQSFDTTPSRVEAITLFPGEQVFLVVDGMGDKAMESRHAGPFELDVRLATDTCPERE